MKACKRGALALLIVATNIVNSGEINNETIDLWGDDAAANHADAAIDLWALDDAAAPQQNANNAINNWQFTKFVEGAAGAFTRQNQRAHDASIAEIRGQFGAARYFGEHYFNSKIEFNADAIADDTLDLQLRELYFDYKFNDALNLRLGQQVLTWGTGDFLFLNDVFAKDWQAMFSGRDDSYLKASEPAVKLTWFNRAFTIDAAWIPFFRGDNHISGERFSYYNPLLGDIVNTPRVVVKHNDNKIKNGQFAIRVSKTHNGTEYAAYAHHGFSSQPSQFDIASGKNILPRMNSLGASVRSPLWGGIANVEFSYWNYLDDKNGSNPFVPNDQLNLLFGYEREIAKNITLGAQWQVQKMQDYDAALASAINPSLLVDEYHHTATARLTWLAMQQKLATSIFAFYSPDSQDFYIKPKISYRQDDNWNYEIGANLFGGRDEFTQWGQFKDNDNIYLRLRYNF